MVAASEAMTPTGRHSEKMKTYIVTSKPGMTPFATETSIRAAKKSAKMARQLGLDGQIIVR
jgi:hypothetical protein